VDVLVDPIITLLTDTLGELPEPLTADTLLGDLDLDSLVLVELSVGLQSRFGVQVPPTDLTHDLTVADVAALAAGDRART